ncbi:MAG: Protein-L-isoaspartate O-methyltransferase [Candidatus Amesbacteria bacterium GW2011_GWA2_47_11b]|uniref:Protein-L-isoaspartate O-methyltransferase n=1 Tax=Candidatus Amesbacteria bacterium GW2011_GWA2_47_11b TaxID=1618358 RepID=A0A0G1UHH6_9BACT|nr:MAG: Protein-L-isoaspartate O-methyltransferase [Candidatus Amesbacteria bacterium GW2011_GWA2_47_11b]
MARLFKQVYSIEKIPELAKRARIKIYELGIKNVRIKIGDGKKGWDKYALYDGIIVAADAQEIPPKLLEQLADGGRMVIPVRGEMLKIEKHGNFVFVPLV